MSDYRSRRNTSNAITELSRRNTITNASSRRVRPTTSRIRAAITSIFGPSNIDGSRCADLYAGTGSVGIEFLSRNAAHVDFVESSRRRASQLQIELGRLHFSSRSVVHRADVIKWLKRTQPLRYDLLFADPPYEDTDLKELVNTVANSGLLAQPTATFILEHSSRIEPPKPSGTTLQYSRTRAYGDSALSIYHHTFQSEH